MHQPLPTRSGAPVRTLPLSLCIGWGLGTLGIAIMFNSTNILVLRFMTDQLGIAASTGGLLVGLSKVYDACMDPVIGGLSDRTQTRWGRRRPFLLAGSILCGLVMVMLFDVPRAAIGGTATVYMAVALVLFATAYASFNVPYLAMPAEMTDDYHERSYLVSFRVLAVSIGQSLGGFLGPAIISNSHWDKRTGYDVMGWSLGAMTFIACFACFLMTGRARFTTRHEGIRIPVWRQFMLAWGNRPFMMLMGAKLFQLIGLSVTQATLAYFTVRVLHASDLVLGMLTLVSTAGIIVTTPAWVWLSRRFGKRLCFMASALIYGGVMTTWLMSSAGEPIALIYGRMFASGFGASGMLLMGGSMLPDTMEYDFRRTGLRREGIFSGIYTTIEKVAFALGVSLLGLFLGAMGYVQSTGRMVEQPPSAITALYVCIGVAPLLTGIISCLFLWKYDLSETRLKAQQVVGA